MQFYFQNVKNKKRK